MVQNALTTVDAAQCFSRIVDPLAWLEKTGHMIYRSGFFGCKSQEQGGVIALISLTEQTPIMELRRRYHITGEGLVMRAEYMRARLRELGGDYDWVNDGEDGKEAKMWIEFRGRRHEVTYTMNDAKKEGIVKSGSRWTKAPGDMLRARCSTKAIRMYASEVLCGFYTDEELGGNGDDPAEAVQASMGDGNTIDVPFEVKPEAKAAENGNGSHTEKASEQSAMPSPSASAAIKESSLVSSPADSCLCTPDQITSIKAAMNELSMPEDKRKAALQKRTKADGTPCMTFPDLSHAQATELLANLRGLIDKRRQAAMDAANGKSAETSAAPATETATAPRHDDGTLCSDVQVAEVMRLLTEINQVSPGFCKEFKSRYMATGRKLVAELTAVQCDALIEQLKHKNLEKFFEESLKPKN